MDSTIIILAMEFFAIKGLKMMMPTKVNADATVSYTHLTLPTICSV